jgi:DEAD/DEAH box helicase domain-containing protein
VIDEIHTYRGVFGSHVANVIRRLRRILNFYSADPVFILTSATIANPISLAEKLVGVKFHLIDQDGSSRGKRDFLIYNPPIIDQEIGLRKSPIQESIRLAEDLFQHDVQTIIFGRTRPTVEIILTYLKQKVGLQTPGIEQIRGYRGGYLPTQRREIEAGLRSGQIRTVVATNALELGIDIGGLGAALLVGFPGTIAATHQQSGRAGRGLDPALSILVATADPIDQFLAHHPDYFFTRTPESALVNPDNLLILINHLKCSTFELPFRKTDIYSNLNNEQTGELLDALVNLGDLHQSGSRYFWMSERYPAQEISLRTSSAENVVLQEISLDDGNEPVRTIGTVDLTSSYWMVHPHAIYLHEAQTFFVKDLDLEKKIANLIRLDTDYYTEPRRETEIDIIERTQNTEDSLIFRGYGEISVKSQVIGFKKIRWFPRESLGFEDLNMPLTNLLTMGYWIVLRNPLVESLRESGLWKNDSNQYGPNWRYQADLARERDEHKCQICGIRETDRAHDVHHKTPFRMFTSVEQANQLSNLITLCPGCHKMVEVNVRVRSGLAGLAYVIGHISPLFLMCDQRDIGVHFDPLSNLFEGLPILVIYESFPAGLGFSKHLFEIHNQIIHEALELVTSCSCSDGCPSCVGPGGENGEGGKEATKALLEKLRL